MTGTSDASGGKEARAPVGPNRALKAATKTTTISRICMSSEYHMSKGVRTLTLG